MRHRTRLAAGIAATAVLAVLVTGCAHSTFAVPEAAGTAAPADDGRDDGSARTAEPTPEETGDPAAAELVEEGFAAVAAAPSLLLDLEYADAVDGRTRMELRLDDDANCVGTFSIAEQGTLEFIRRGTEMWARPDRQFWRTISQESGETADEEFLDLLIGYYLYSPDAAPEFGTDEMCELDALLDMMRGGGLGPLEFGGDTTHEGTAAREVLFLDQPGSALIAAEGEPYLLLFQDPVGRMEFGEFGVPVEITPPPDDRVIDISDFRSGDIDV